MNFPKSNDSKRALARVELVAVLCGVALLGALSLPLLGTTHADSERAGCLNNLRLMGRAAVMWASEHENGLSWRVPAAQGGTFQNVFRSGNAWAEYAFLSNELATPRILACPADLGVSLASNFSAYTSVPFRASATSYLINVHADLEHSAVPLFADRNLRISSAGSSCSFVNMPNVDQITAFDSTVGWTNAVHGLRGNSVMIDGSVTTTTPEMIRLALRRSDVNGSIHLLRAR
jgi:hypothetical protein